MLDRRLEASGAVGEWPAAVLLLFRGVCGLASAALFSNDRSPAPISRLSDGRLRDACLLVHNVNQRRQSCSIMDCNIYSETAAAGLLSRKKHRRGASCGAKRCVPGWRCGETPARHHY